MFDGAKTWNPFVGCRFKCIYCEKSFQVQMKRRIHDCPECAAYEPHFHIERLTRIPDSKLVFFGAYGDVAFMKPYHVPKSLAAMRTRPHTTFLSQSKQPRVYVEWEAGRKWDSIPHNFNYELQNRLPDNLVVGTTLETNYSRFYGFGGTPYEMISCAPQPYERIFWMQQVHHKRKYVVVEPILDFDKVTLASDIKSIQPEFVYVGSCNHNYKELKLPEPPLEKTMQLIEELEKFTEVRRKTLRRAWYE